MFIEVSKNLKELSEFFPEDLYVVGGYVRNKILKISATDIDICSSANIDEVSKRLSGSPYSVKVKNLKLGSLLISRDDEVYEYTAFRKEVYKDGGHYPVGIEFSDKIEDDAMRRDFSVNAIYYDINKDKCVDLCHGIVDLSDKLIRNIHESVLKNDGERILRMVRIAGELGFDIEKETLKNAIQNVDNLKDISGNRKYIEIDKILYSDKKYNTKSALKRSMGLLNILGIWQSFGLYYKKINFKMVFRCEERFLGFLIDIIDTEKPECLETFLEKFLKEQFGFNSSSSKKVFELLDGYYSALSKTNNKKYFFEHFENWNEIRSLVGAKSKHIQSKYDFFYKYIIEHHLAIKVSDLEISAQDLEENFPIIDKRSYDYILQDLLDKVFDGKIKNTKDSLLGDIKKNF